ncbi:Uncharacterised protein [Mycobacteroides abscessus]|nr:Uncharacterised protein [Mycobacteroides abscessus]
MNAAFQPWKTIASEPSGAVTTSCPPGPRTSPWKRSLVMSSVVALVHGPARLGAVAYDVRYAPP